MNACGVNFVNYCIIFYKAINKRKHNGRDYAYSFHHTFSSLSSLFSPRLPVHYLPLYVVRTCSCCQLSNADISRLLAINWNYKLWIPMHFHIRIPFTSSFFCVSEIYILWMFCVSNYLLSKTQCNASTKFTKYEDGSVKACRNS